jgi:hypothetical protein
VLTIATLVLVPSGVVAATRADGDRRALVLSSLARLYTAVDHPSDVAASPSCSARRTRARLHLLTPEEAFPVTYRRGCGPTSTSVAAAARRSAGPSPQLDVDVVDVEPFGSPAAPARPRCA